MRIKGGSLSSRPLLVAPFLVGGLAGAWVAATSATLALVATGWASSALAAGTIVLLLTAAPAHRQRGGLAGPDGRVERWPARPMWSFIVRSVAVFAPIGVSVSAALAVQEALPPPSAGWSVAGHVLILLVSGLGVLYPAEQATRRLGPIAMLLKLSLAFPSSAPSRFRVARRSGNVGTLRKTLDSRHTTDDQARTEIAGTLLSLVAALTAHDSRTRGHSERVRVFTEMLAVELGVDEPSRQRLRWSALLHDIGKMAVSAEILNKPGPLDEDQWRAVRGHPAAGAELVAPLVPWLGEWGSAVVEHHERLDGSGYPHGLEREQISLGARIIAVADAFDTMVTPRAYRGAMSPAAARQEVARFSARQFDPRVVRALMSLSIPRLWWRIGLAAWLAHLPLLRRRGSDRSRGTPARNPLPVAGTLSLLAAVVALSASGLLGDQGSDSGDRGAAVRSALESSPSGTITAEVGLGGEQASSTGGDGPNDGNAGGADGLAPVVGSDPAGTAPSGEGISGGSGNSGNGGDGGGGSAGGSGGGGGAGGGGTVGTGGGGGTVGAAGGGGTSEEANSDATVGGAAGDGTTGGATGDAGGAGGSSPPVVEPPGTQDPPPSSEPPPSDCSDGDPGQNGNGHAYGHCKDKGKP